MKYFVVFGDWVFRERDQYEIGFAGFRLLNNCVSHIHTQTVYLDLDFFFEIRLKRNALVVTIDLMFIRFVCLFLPNRSE